MGDTAARAESIRFAGFELDLRSRELKQGDARLKLPNQSIEILRALLERPGEIVTRDELRERLWPSDTFVDFEHGLNAAVRRLREALGDSADTPRFVETLPRRGYRYVGPIERAEPDGGAASVDVMRGSAPTGMSAHFKRGALLVAALGVVWLAAAPWILPKDAPSAALAATRPVTTYPGLEMDPSVSPDGDRVAFVWDGPNQNGRDIYVKLIDGGDPLRLTTHVAPERQPAWSPDGNQIAFLRRMPELRVAVLVVPAMGGTEQDVTEVTMPVNTASWPNGLSWTPDGKSLILIDRTASGSFAVYRHSLQTGERFQLTFPTRDFSDSLPVISPDGRYLAFARRIATTGGRVFVQPLAELQPVGEPRPLTLENGVASLDWTPDSDAVLFARDGTLWQVPLAGGKAQPVITNAEIRRFSAARRRNRVVFSRERLDRNIWRTPGPLDTAHRTDPAATVRIIDSTFSDSSPQLSPDEQHLVFISDRSGESALWTAKPDGSALLRVTTGDVGSPRWSPDGQRIAFDSMRSGRWGVYTVGSQGGAVQTVVEGDSNNVRPSWSRDGRWIYFGSNRSGTWQIWKAAATGGPPKPITRNGGWEAFESPDGKYLYYAKRADQPGIWRVPVDGGEEVQIIDHGMETSWAVIDAGVVLMDKLAKPQATLEFYRFDNQRLARFAQLPAGVRLDSTNPSLAASRDGKSVLYVAFDEWRSDIEMIEGFSLPSPAHQWPWRW